jgi:hypothetical protein
MRCTGATEEVTPEIGVERDRWKLGGNGTRMMCALITVVLQTFGCASRQGVAQATPPAASDASTAGVVATEHVVAGKLTITVVAHTIATAQGNAACWSYVSEGLSGVGQKEIVFTVKRGPGEADRDYPRNILGFYGLVYQVASEGQWVDNGDTTILGPTSDGLFGARWRGIIYTDTIGMKGVDVRSGQLMAVVVSAAEVEVAQRMGVMRVLSRLGQANAFFPTTPWLDRDRSEVTSPGDLDKSILVQTRTAHFAGATVHQDSAGANPGADIPVGKIRTVEVYPDLVTLTLPSKLPDDARQAIGALGDDDPVAILTGPDRTASMAIVWQPGQSAPTAIVAPDTAGARIAGNFVLFLPGRPENKASILEDGFVVELSADAWIRVRQAMARGEPISVSGGDGKRIFTMAWQSKRPAD